jgi:hypothetical protein
MRKLKISLLLSQKINHLLYQRLNYKTILLVVHQILKKIQKNTPKKNVYFSLEATKRKNYLLILRIKKNIKISLKKMKKKKSKRRKVMGNLILRKLLQPKNKKSLTSKKLSPSKKPPQRKTLPGFV